MTYGMEEYYDHFDNNNEKEMIKVMKRVWNENAEACINQNAIETARAIYFNSIALYPLKKSLWFNAIKLEE
jgi:hypothetical protein